MPLSLLGTHFVGADMGNDEKRKAALEYLKSRGLYLLDGKFRPTCAAATDVATTIARYKAQTGGVKLKLTAKVK